MWYIVAFAGVIGLVIWWFLTSQYGMSFVVLLLAGVFYFVENNAADEMTVSISDLWVSVGEMFYDFAKIRSFCYLYDGQTAKILRLKVDKRTISNLDLDIDNAIAAELKAILPNYLKEDPRWEFSFSDRFIRLMKL